MFPSVVEVLGNIAVHPKSHDFFLLERGRKIKYEIENQVSFAARIGAVHQNVCFFHHGTHYVQLFFGAFDFHQTEFFGQERQVGKAPGSFITGVSIQRGKGNQVTDAPCNAMILADEAAVSLCEFFTL